MAKRKLPQDELLNHSYDGIEEYDNQLPGWWKSLFYVTIIIGVLYLLHFHVFGTGDLAEIEYLREIDPDYVPHQSAKHGVLFTSYKTPIAETEGDVTPRELALMKSTGEVADTSATDTEVKEVPAVAISEPINDAARLADAKTFYETQCAACHGKLGEGGIGPNLTDEYWIHGSTMPEVVKVITKGVPAKGMIAWEKTMTPDQIDAMASFILLKLQGTKPPNAKGPEGEKTAK